jgi:hypothetical protein
MTATAIYWETEDSAGANFADAHAHVTTGKIPFTGITMTSRMLLSELRLVPVLPWNRLVAVILAHFNEGWETLLFVALAEDGTPEAVSMPSGVLVPGIDGVPDGFIDALLTQVRALIDAGQIDTVDDNLAKILA